jgi:DNA-directed RNA polymerase alpha subunit
MEFSPEKLTQQDWGLDDTQISIRLLQLLEKAGIQTVKELATKTEAEIREYTGINNLMIKEVEDILKEKGLSLTK